MSEYFKSVSSALSNIHSTFSSSGDPERPGSSTDNPFVGQTVELEGQRLRVERVIAEGECLNCLIDGP